MAHDYKKRPHVFRVTLGSGAQYLFEANNYVSMNTRNIHVMYYCICVYVGVSMCLPVYVPGGVDDVSYTQSIFLMGAINNCMIL